MSDGSNYMKFLNRKSDNSALARDREIGTVMIRVIMQTTWLRGNMYQSLTHAHTLKGIQEYPHFKEIIKDVNKDLTTRILVIILHYLEFKKFLSVLLTKI